MAIYVCPVCDHQFDEEEEGLKWEELPEDWCCPVCESEKSMFEPEKCDLAPAVEEKAKRPDDTGSFRRTSDDLEVYMADIHAMAETGRSISEPMRTKKPVVSWDDIFIMGTQLSRFPLNSDETVDTKTLIGPRAKQPMEIDIPVIVSHMSYGALSKEAKIALSRGSAGVKTAICSGEGGILPESISGAYKYIFEYVPNRYSVTEENLKRADAVEIKIGQSAKPGMGGHLPANKVTKEIAEIRDKKEGGDIISPARFNDISCKDGLKSKVEWIRSKSGGRPVGIKIAAGHIEEDLEIALYAQPDFITLDGRPGATGSAPKYVKASASVPSIFALYRARKYFEDKKIKGVSLIITGGLRISSDFAKALALGADAVAIGTSALIACGCQQYRICNTGKCPAGIATQDPELRSRFNIDTAAAGLKNFLTVTVEELKVFSRLTGNSNIHSLSVNDIRTINSEISGHTDIKHV